MELIKSYDCAIDKSIIFQTVTLEISLFHFENIKQFLYKRKIFVLQTKQHFHKVEKKYVKKKTVD